MLFPLPHLVWLRDPAGVAAMHCALSDDLLICWFAVCCHKKQLATTLIVLQTLTELCISRVVCCTSLTCFGLA